MTSTAALIERGRQGDSQALAVLFGQHTRRLLGFAHYRMGPELRGRYEAEDVVQETMLRAARDFSTFTYASPGAFYRWLTSIARHVMADLARHEGRLRRSPEELVALSGADLADTLTPSRIAAQREQIGQLVARLNDLPDDSREVVVLAKFEGLPPAEIALRLGRTREQVALLLHRALKRLRDV
jgi:RNA polymerase sigma-70 factor (ECF subfamily)